MATRPPVPDYYTILGIKSTANAIEIQRSYRKLARAWRQPGKTGVGVLAMAAIDEAYDTLKDVEKKTYYDSEYPRIRVAWKAYQKRKTIAAQADDDAISIHSSDADDEDEDEDCDDENDTDDGGPDGEAIDEEYTDRELSDDEEDLSSQPFSSSGKMVIVIDSEDEKEEKSEEETEAEFTDGEEPDSDDEKIDERVDRYAHFCTGYAADSESDEDEGRYAIRLRSGAWVERDQHYHDDPNHQTCDLEEY